MNFMCFLAVMSGVTVSFCFKPECVFFLLKGPPPICTDLISQMYSKNNWTIKITGAYYCFHI